MVKVEYKNLTEKKLVKRSQNEDLLAFEELLTRNKEKLLGWIISFSKKPHAAEEIYQIATIKCWQNIKKFKGDSKFLTWACTIARNLFYDTWRKNAKYQIYSFEDLLEKEQQEGLHFQMKIEQHTDTDFTSQMDSKQNLNKIHKKLNVLSPKHKEALLLSAEEGLGYKEIAKRQNVPVGTVMSRIFYARKVAQKKLKSLNEEFSK